jgi:uncharacterized protein
MMMRNIYRIADSDRHVIEPIDIWKEYLPLEYREHAPYYEYIDRGEPLVDRIAFSGAEGEFPAPPDLMVDGMSVLRLISRRALKEMAISASRRRTDLIAAQSPEGHLLMMDREGIDVAAIFPTFAAALVSIDTMDAGLAAAFAHAYNLWLRDFCSIAPDRLRGVGLISRHDPSHMLSELKLVAAFGWTTVVMRPNPVKERLLSDPVYEPFWSVCEQLSINVALHEGTHTRLPAAGADRFRTHFALHACSHPIEQMMALLTLIEGGVLERHPRLRFAFLEAGSGWLPYWLWRLDELEYKQVGGEVIEHVRMRPSEYFRRQCCIGIEPGEPNLQETIRWAGDDNILFGTDFPHFDRDEEILDEALRLQTLIPRNVLSQLLWNNAAVFYKFSNE